MLTLILICEGLGGAALLWVTIQSSFAAADEPLAQRLSILIALLLAWIWVCATLAGALSKRAPWARGSALTIHVLLFAAGTGVLQGILGDPLLGWALVLLALVGFFAAVLARPTVPAAPGDPDRET
ncbi:hypothetical protein JD276_11520 [Leucobacter sp. CSA1]|uniref:DUF2568 domain-containing protein n=1 Tax=Leucobacter chromiisoli TaxID=2796471 RepID=A0A934QAR4_9MICO|nr:hypothetical protein [Leucobacter chromiisoli]